MIPSVYVRQHQHRYKIPSLIQLHQITKNESNKLPPDISAKFYNLQWEFECFQTSYERLQWKLWSGISSLESPQHKGRVPQYLQDKLSDLQQKFDQLEQLGVFKKLGDISVVAEEYPSYQKANRGYCLVTSFGKVARYLTP